MNKSVKLGLKIFKNIVAITLFFSILIFGIINLSVLLRFEEDEFSTKQMAGYYSEEKGNLDVVCIGSSSTYRYNIPTLLWEEKKITSYNYSTASQPFDAMKYLVKEAKRTQDPKLYVVDVRNFIKKQLFYAGKYAKNVDAYYEREVSYTSRMVNTIPFSLERLGMINATVPSLRGEKKFDWLFDLSRTHNNWKKIKVQDVKDYIVINYKLLDYSAKEPYKGNKASGNYKYFDSRYIPDENYYHDFNDDGWKMIKDLLEYVDKEKLNVVFLSTPYLPKEDWWGLENTLIKYINENYKDNDKIKYLNGNLRFNEIGLDLKTDFYDYKHLNINGAIKFTKYFGQYIVDNYNLKPSKVSKEYAKEWDDAHTLWWNELGKVQYEKVQKRAEKAIKENS